jgi:hypothetical protein
MSHTLQKSNLGISLILGAFATSSSFNLAPSILHLTLLFIYYSPLVFTISPQMLTSSRQHFNKMKREFAKAGGGGGGGGASTGTSTPARGKRETPSSRKGSQLKSTKSFAETLDDDDEMPTPSAKRKRTVKEESGGDMGGFAGQNAMQFKSEFRVNGSDSSQPVDLHDSE